jgi:diguanylate cyclase (GGDEF)-like protein/PAS domain S-box-containing protein
MSGEDIVMAPDGVGSGLCETWNWTGSDSMDGEEIGILVFDANACIVFANGVLARLSQCSATELVGQPVGALLPDLAVREDSAEGLQSSPIRRLSQGVWQSLRLTRGADEAALPVEAVLHGFDASGTRHFLVSLRGSPAPGLPLPELRRLAWAAEQGTEAVMITDSDGVIQYVNSAYEALTGFARVEAVGKPAAIVKSGLHDADFYRTLWATIRAGNVFRGVLANRKKSGEIYYEEKIIRPFADGRGRMTHYVATARDMTDHVLALARLEQLANYDSLTGLPNRNLFMDRLRQALLHTSRRGGRFALACIDVDDLKSINDTLGHAAGDAVLHAVGQRLKHSIREGDTVGRLSGDEFALILEDLIEIANAATVLEKIVSAFSAPVSFEEHMVPVSVSIGVCTYPDDGMDERLLLRHADLAMYDAKAAGRNGYRFFAADQPAEFRAPAPRDAAVAWFSARLKG